MPYFDFSYYINPENASYPGPCPGPGKPAQGKLLTLFPSDTWCALDEPDDHFYDHGLANATIARLKYAAARQALHGSGGEGGGGSGQPFFIQAGFARPHAPWRVPQRFWDLYNTDAIPLPKHRFPPDGMCSANI